MKGGAHFFGAMVDVCVDFAGFVLLPFGFMEATIGAPFGLFRNGVSHMGSGCLAPMKAMWSMMKVPVRIFTG